MKISNLSINISLALIAGISIGLLIGQNNPNAPEATLNPETDSYQPDVRVETSSTPLELIRLENLLKDETLARQSLQTEIEDLKLLVASLSENLKAKSSEPGLPQPSQQQRAQPNRQVFDREALLDAGMTTEKADDLKSFFERQELERLHIRDQSIREAWSREQFRDAMQALQNNNADTLDGLNDHEYDAFLYATGQSNRVEVSSVLDSSQAQLAGLQAGDHILRYDGSRVYSWNELRSATTQGLLGEQILIEIERDGSTVEYYVDRGPLGIRMNSISQKP